MFTYKTYFIYLQLRTKKVIAANLTLIGINLEFQIESERRLMQVYPSESTSNGSFMS